MGDIYDPLSFMQLDMGKNFKNGRHLKLCNEKIMQLFNGDFDKLLISLGPRHGKSSIATYALSYFALTHAYDGLEAMVISYGKTLAEGICQTSRELVEFYGDMEMDDTWNRKDSWQFKRPGKFRAHAHGVDGPITGKGADRDYSIKTIISPAIPHPR